jgi:hypothetical protein
MNKLRTIFIINLSHGKFVMSEKWSSYFTNCLWNCQPYEELCKINCLGMTTQKIMQNLSYINSLKFFVTEIKTNDMSNACDDHTS